VRALLLLVWFVLFACVFFTTMGVFRWLYLSFVIWSVDDDAIRISMDYAFKSWVVMMPNILFRLCLLIVPS